MKMIKKDLDISFVNKWAAKNFNPIILSLISRRGFSCEEDILDVFYPVFENIINPFIFKDLEKAFERLEKAIDNREKIMIFGDRDVDGTTSVAILYKYLQNLGLDCSFLVPGKHDDYGLNKKKFAEWKENKISLCFTVDCGISNTKEVELLNELGIDTIIIDHHNPPEILPDAYAIINPKCEPEISIENIAACGVVFLMIYGHLLYKSQFYKKNIALIYTSEKNIILDQYVKLFPVKKQIFRDISSLEKTDFDLYYIYTEKELDNEVLQKSLPGKKIIVLNQSEFLKIFDSIDLKARLQFFNNINNNTTGLEYAKANFLPLVMVGLLADVMPLLKTNRILVKIGFEYFKKTKLESIRSLCEKLDIDINEMTVKDILWLINPVLNASGRMENAKTTVDFLISENKYERFISEMLENNQLRKKSGENALNIFKDKITENKSRFDGNLLFFYSTEIHRGITGITATRIAEKSNCPVIIACTEGEYVTGSVRGDTSYHFVDFLSKAADILEDYGGHKSAAGFRFKKEKLEDFSSFLKANSHLFSEPSKEDEINIDAEIPLSYLNYDLFKIIEILEPMGECFSRPVLFTKGIKVKDFSAIGKEKHHLKLYFDIPPYNFPGLFWNKAQWFISMHNTNNFYNILYEIEFNRYNNQTIPQLNIIDMAIVQ